MGRIFITGDKHGDFSFLPLWCKQNNTTLDDILIILGDAGINYYGGKKDKRIKAMISKCPITLICVHGNHEARPSTIPSYILTTSPKIKCNYWVEREYPNIIFPMDGTMEINGKRFLILGGAYSIDKFFRISCGYNWFSDEQMSREDRNRILDLIKTDNSFDYILSHTAPLSYEPKYLFLPLVDQSKVDKTMEKFLQDVYDKVRFNHWYFGHYHDDNELGEKITIVFNNYIQIL